MIELYKEKKHFLEEFFKVNLQGLSQFSQNNFEEIESFYYKREQILEILLWIDEKINNQPPVIIKSESPLSLLLLEIKALTQIILKQDMEILTLMENTKNTIIKDLQSLRKNKKSVSGYKTKVDHHQIDEEI